MSKNSIKQEYMKESLFENYRFIDSLCYLLYRYFIFFRYDFII